MEIKIPKVLVTLDLGGYAPDLTGETVQVWVNPPLAVLREHDELIKANNDAEAFAWYARAFSQGSSALTADDLRTLQQADPAFWGWLVRSYWEARGEHISKKKRS